MVRRMGPHADELRTISLFQGFSDEDLIEVSTLFTKVSDARVPLFDVQEPARSLYLLTQGEVTLDRPGDDVFKLRPPALIGELGALTGLARSTRALVQEGSVVWELSARKLQAFLAERQELGVRFLVNLLSVVADKVHRDQRRMADMRGNLMRTQKELKRLRELVLETVETPLSAPVHDTLDKLITHNRRVNYRVEPPAALAATVKLEHYVAPIIDISRTHLTMQVPDHPPGQGSWVTGVAQLAGAELPISGRVHRSQGNKVTIELDMMIDEFVATLEGYLTRAQLLDIMC